MDVRLIIAIIRRDKLEEVEQKLRDTGVEGIEILSVKGYGEYRNFFAQNWMTDEVRIEIFTRKDEVQTIVTALMDAAHTGLAGDGVVAVIPIETLYRIRTQSEANPREFFLSHPL